MSLDTASKVDLELYTIAKEDSASLAWLLERLSASDKALPVQCFDRSSRIRSVSTMKNNRSDQAVNLIVRTVCQAEKMAPTNIS